MERGVRVYGLFGTVDLHSTKVTLYQKNDITTLPQRFTIDFFSFNWLMEISLLLDFLFNINFNVLIELNPFTLEGIQISIPQFQIPQIPLPPSEQYTKCYWGQSTFNNCYYDPQFTIENTKRYLKGSINRVSKNMSIPDFLSGVNYNEFFQYYANRILNTAIQLIEKTVLMDLAILDFSAFSPENPDGETYMEFQWLTTNPQLNQEMEYPQYATVDDLMWGTVLDWMYLDTSLFTSEEQSILGQSGAQFFDAVINAVMSNYNPFQSANKLAFFDPTAPPLIQPLVPGWSFSQRTEDWGASMNLMGIVRTAVRRMLANTITNPFLINAYEDAMVEYCMAFQHNHDRERERAWVGVGIDVFNQAWVSKWVGLGLDQQILNSLIGNIGVVCQRPLIGRKGVNSPLQSQS
jgi:hypothetical protein